MAIAKHLSSIKRFGPRYGNIVKHKFAIIENQQRSEYKCPYCSKNTVTRIAAGIWQCGKCDAKFAGKAYTVQKKRPLIEAVEAFKEEEVGAEPMQEEAEQIEEE